MTELRPEGPAFNSHAREGVVAIVSTNCEARRAGTFILRDAIKHCSVPHLRRSFVLMSL